MTREKHIGIVIPRKNPQMNVVEGNGILPDDVRAALIAGLNDSPEIASVTHCDLDAAYIKNGKVYEGGRCLSDLDLVHWYFITYLPDSWHMVILNALAKTTRVVPDPSAMLLGLDKYYAHTALRHAGVPTTEFSLFRADKASALADKICANGPVLLKPRRGGFGHGIHMVRSAREMVDAVEYTQSFSADMPQIFCEEFEENDITQWISTTVIGGELVYGYRKKPEKFVDNWKVYDADRIGGGVDYVDPEPVRDVALKAASALGCDVVGFDFIYSSKKGKYFIVDENTFPGMYPECFRQAGTGTWDEHFLRMLLQALGNPDAKNIPMTQAGNCKSFVSSVT